MKKYKIGDFEWTIQYATADEIKKELKDNNLDSYYYGITTTSLQRILINKEVSKEQQLQTLYHELLHAYITSYFSNEGLQEEEFLCNISAKSHNLIHNIANDFLNKENK